MASERIVASITYKNSDCVQATHKVILKIHPMAKGLSKDLVEHSHLFQTEMSIISEVLPKIAHLLKITGEKKLLHPR
jgi:hypothetical protein